MVIEEAEYSVRKVKELFIEISSTNESHSTSLNIYT